MGCTEFHMTEVTLHAHMLLSHFCGRGGCGDTIQVMPNPGEDLTWFWSSIVEVRGRASMVVREVGGGEAAVAGFHRVTSPPTLPSPPAPIKRRPIILGSDVCVLPAWWQAGALCPLINLLPSWASVSIHPGEG